MVVYSGRTVEQAIEKGLKDLNLPRMKAHIKVISREKKGFLGFGKKPARVSVEPINEKIAHEADQNTVKVAPDAIKQLDDSVASPKDETIAFNKVTKLVAVSDNKEIAHEDLKQPVSTETLDEELPRFLLFIDLSCLTTFFNFLTTSFFIKVNQVEETNWDKA